MLCPKSTSINIINLKFHLTVGPLFIIVNAPVYCPPPHFVCVSSSHLACELCCSYGRVGVGEIKNKFKFILLSVDATMERSINGNCNGSCFGVKAAEYSAPSDERFLVINL